MHMHNYDFYQIDTFKFKIAMHQLEYLAHSQIALTII